MNRITLIELPALSVAALSMLLFSASGLAQTSEAQSGLKVPPSLDQPQSQPQPQPLPELTVKENDDGTGLTVEELRFNDRLGEVTIQHGEGGIREYYDMNRNDEIYQDGSLIDHGAMRSWRLGGGR